MFKLVAITFVLATLAIAAPELPPISHNGLLEAVVEKKLSTILARHPIFAAVGNSTAASAEMLVHASLFEKIMALVLPIICDTARKLTIPPINEKHFSVGEITLSEFDIKNISVKFASPNQVQILLTGFTMAIPKTPFQLKDKILDASVPQVIGAADKGGFHIHCKGHLWASVENTNFDVTATLSRDPNNRLAIDASAAVNWGKLNIHQKMDHWACKLVDKIASMFLHIDKIVQKLLRNKIGPEISKAIKKAMDKAAKAIPFALGAPPVATSDSIQLTLDLIGNGNALPSTKIPSTFPSRDVELATNSWSVDSLFSAIQASGKLNIPLNLNITTDVFAKILKKVYMMCPGCPLTAYIDFTQAPTTNFAYGAAGFDTTQTVLKLTGVNGTERVLLFGVNLNASGNAQNFSVSGALGNTIKFDIQLKSVSITAFDNSLPAADVALLSDVLKYVIQDVIVKAFNKKFKGITIPALDGIQLENLESSFHNKGAQIGLDIDFTKP
jgi:hypothetical protein